MHSNVRLIYSKKYIKPKKDEIFETLTTLMDPKNKNQKILIASITCTIELLTHFGPGLLGFL